ncbi:MAG: ribonuclease HII [Bacteroidales bacterium]|nr:ribonuclease HII [Candidatus Colicola caccequi]MCQ2328479.1 ribonuclease HII [Paludibacteraceae bacterium]
MLLPYCIPNVIEAGCDEAGRGPLAGSVFAAAVVLPQDFRNEMLNDSKQLTEKQREQLRPIIEKEALAWAVAEVTAAEIDQINILNASLLGMRRALDKVCQQLALTNQQLAHILVDGNRWKPYVPEGGVLEVPARTVVHGDATYMSIAAASILAKTYRDDYMRRLSQQYPQYGWDRNMGYPTKEHYEALKQFGPTPYHRLTFKLK